MMPDARDPPKETAMTLSLPALALPALALALALCESGAHALTGPPASETVSSGSASGEETVAGNGTQGSGAPTGPDAQAGEEIVRLPPRGELREELSRADLRDLREARAQRPREVILVPGGGLILSFDADGDGEIDAGELSAGIAAQFGRADLSGDGVLTPLEQIRWAESLPTRDDTLGNPARFDPNLDRQVSVAEFEAVIRQLAGVHTQADTGRLLVEDLYMEVERPRDLVAVGLFEGGGRPGER
jgi:hypothetical protein